MTSKPIVGDRVEPLGGGAEGAAGDLAGLRVLGGALGAREELVPAAEQRARAVGVRRERALDGDQVAQRVAREHVGELAACERREPGGDRARRCRVRRLDGARRRSGVSAVGLRGRARRGPARAAAALGEHQLGVDVGGDLDPGGVLPGGERVATRPGSRRSRRPRRPGSPRPRSGRVRRRTFVIRTGGRRLPRGRSGRPRRRACRAPRGTPWRVTGNGSPTVALAGCRPRSTRGVTSMTGMRPTMLSTLARSGAGGRASAPLAAVRAREPVRRRGAGGAPRSVDLELGRVHRSCPRSDAVLQSVSLTGSLSCSPA